MLEYKLSLCSFLLVIDLVSSVPQSSVVRPGLTAIAAEPVGGTLPGYPVYNAVDILGCQDLCLKNPQCMFALFKVDSSTNQNICWLKPTSALIPFDFGLTQSYFCKNDGSCSAFQKGTPASPVISARSLDAQGISLAVSAEPIGPTLAGYPIWNVVNAEGCRRLCLVTSDCRFAFHKYDNADICFLKSAGYSLRAFGTGSYCPIGANCTSFQIPSSAPAVVSGMFNVGAIEPTGTDLPGYPVNNIDAQQCQTLCLRNPECEFALFKQIPGSTRTCWLKNLDNDLTAFSAGVNCRGTDGGYCYTYSVSNYSSVVSENKGMEPIGPTLAGYPVQNIDEAGCRSLCWQTQDCDALLFRYGPGFRSTCWLKSKGYRWVTTRVGTFCRVAGSTCKSYSVPVSPENKL
jgi:hypothetical protein